MTDIQKALSLYHSAAPSTVRDSAQAMDAAPSDSYADLRIAVAQDASFGWKEEAHPRAIKGSKGAGQFTTKPETISNADFHEVPDSPDAVGVIAKSAAPVGTSVRASTITERGKSFTAIDLRKNDRSRFTPDELSKIVSALSANGYSNVEAETDPDSANQATIFCDPPSDPGEAAASYMEEVEKYVPNYSVTDDARESARIMGKNVDSKNPAKRIQVDFQDWSYEDGLKETPSKVGKEEEATDGKVFESVQDAAKWLVSTKDAPSLEGDASWFSSVSQKGGKWKAYKLTPVNFTEQEILDIDRLVAKGRAEMK